MDEKILNKIQILFAWSGLLFVIVYGLSWVVLGHNYPPPNPAFTAQELVNNFYVPFKHRILLGQSLSTCFGIFYATWSIQLTVQLWAREKDNHLLSLTNLVGGLLTGWVLIFCPAIWAWCAEFAGTVPAEMTKAAHFIAWYTYDMTYMITTIQAFAIFAFVLADKHKPAIMPRWAAGLTLFSGLSFLPLTFLPYFKSGIFAINGYWSYHVAFISYGIFTAVLSYYMVQDLKRIKTSTTPGIGQAISHKQY